MENKQWQKLPVDDLWIKCSFKEDCYSIWLTDLCQLYTEELDADDLRWRARKAKLPVDIEEQSNLTTILKRLSESVMNGELTIPSSSNTSRHMDIAAKVHLPKPLPDADWVFKLELQEDAKFREAVSKPLLTRIETFEEREDDLVHRLHDKDHAIEKLMDTLEKYSVDLADVFPSLAAHSSARQTGGRRHAAAHIPALQTFNKETWLESIANGKRYERPTLVNSRTESGTFEAVVPRTASKETQSKEKSPPPAKKPTNNGIKRKIGGTKAPTPLPVESETESEKEAAAPSPPPQANGSKSIKKTLGGKKAAPALVPGSDAVTDVSDPENQSSPKEKLKTIKRTLGGKRVASEQEHTSVVSPTKKPSATGPEPNNGSEHQRDGETEAALDDEEAADRKRAELKQQFVAAAAHKSKKRKF